MQSPCCNLRVTTWLLAAVVYNNVESVAGAVTSDSIPQIRDTLQNLLRSIEDSGQEAESLFEKRQGWCKSAIASFEAHNEDTATSLSDMEAQITEGEAEVLEAEGTVQQVKVDIEMAQHTIENHQKNVEMLKQQESPDARSLSILGELVRNKQQSLVSLQGELDTSVPAMSRVQTSVDEMKQRVSFRTDSAAAGNEFIAALEDGCQQVSLRADTQNRARMSESNSIRVALQAVMALGSTVPKQNAQQDAEESSPPAQQDAEESSPPSFVQTSQSDSSQEVSDDDLSDLFAQQQEQQQPRPDPVDSEHHAAAPRQHTSQGLSSLKPRVQALIAQLRQSAAASTDQSAWCASQRESGQLALKFAQDSVAQASSERDTHSEAEANIAEELQTLNVFAIELRNASVTFTAQAGLEQALIQNNRKDQKLANKILEQAANILKELAAGPGIAKVLAALQDAQKLFIAKSQADVDFEHQASLKGESIVQKAGQVAQVQDIEEHNLQWVQDDHESQRLRSVEDSVSFQDDVKQATAYLKELEESCKNEVQSMAQQQNSAQVQALEDASQALDGKLEAPPAAMRGLRGHEKKKPVLPAADLTPMQRAALEMGLSLDESE